MCCIAVAGMMREMGSAPSAPPHHPAGPQYNPYYQQQMLSMQMRGMGGLPGHHQGGAPMAPGAGGHMMSHIMQQVRYCLTL